MMNAEPIRQVVTEMGLALPYADEDSLVSGILYLTEISEAVDKAVYEAKKELQARMATREATLLITPQGTAEIKEVGSSYDPNIFDMLLEHIAEEDLVAKGALTLEHKETRTVLRKWNATKAKPFGDLGSEVRQIIEKARIPGAKQLIVNPIKEGG